MSYTPTTWSTGDVITAEKLNNMESGIVGANDSVFEISANGETTLNKTRDEILEAINGGKRVCYVVVGNGGPDSALVSRLPLTKFTRQRIDGETPPAGGPTSDGTLMFSGIDWASAVNKVIFYFVTIYLYDMTYEVTQKSLQV